ncbi:hypothetical protein ACA910_012013 [Epithemia clementina (nom. ined.)]
MEPVEENYHGGGCTELIRVYMTLILLATSIVNLKQRSSQKGKARTEGREQGTHSHHSHSASHSKDEYGSTTRKSAMMESGLLATFFHKQQFS